jgi:hypothetical protein
MKSHIARPNEETMVHRRRRIAPARLAILVVFSLIAVASLVRLSKAAGINNQDRLDRTMGNHPHRR